MPQAFDTRESFSKFELRLDLHLLRYSEENYGPSWRTHLFDQYKLTVEMTDRISARRMQANSFFLGINTALVTVISVLLTDKQLIARGWLALPPLAALLLFCFVWWRIVASYRQLNSGKYRVVAAFEALLPSAPYATEWEFLGRGRNPSLYLPLTNIKQWVPLAFCALYLLLGVISVVGASQAI